MTVTSNNPPTTSENISRSLLILYATETGNAMDVAEQIAREALRQAFVVRVISTDAYPLEDLVYEHLIVFVISTTGSGVQPRSMNGLWNMLLRSDLPMDLFEGLDYAVFGLGDSAYEKFCWAAKKLSRRLETLGGWEIIPRGEADEKDAMGIDGALDAWIPGLFKAFDHISPLPPTASIADELSLPPPRIQLVEQGKEEFIEGNTRFPATVSVNKRITEASWFQDVRHIEFNLKDISYCPGDVAVIYPENREEDVDRLVRVIGWDTGILDKELEFAEADQGLPVDINVPRRTTLRHLFVKYLDICSVPRRSFFRIIRHFAKNELHKEKLFELSSRSAEGIEDLYEYVTRPRRTILEVLDEFQGVQIPLEYILDVFPLIRPRQFSIASSAKMFPGQVHLCVAIVNYKTKLSIPRRGVCTSYMAALRPGDKISIGIEKGYLQMPTDPTTHIVCVGPGTGVAPMRALIDERVHHGSRENTLYFGCRSSTKDAHYADEWAALVDAQQLTYRPAFSRDFLLGEESDGPIDQNGKEARKADKRSGRRVYVQDLIAADAKRVWELIGERGAWVYIAGSSNQMPTAVKGAIEAAARDVGGQSEEEAKAFMKRLLDEGRLFEECWS